MRRRCPPLGSHERHLVRLRLPYRSPRFHSLKLEDHVTQNESFTARSQMPQHRHMSPGLSQPAWADGDFRPSRQARFWVHSWKTRQDTLPARRTWISFAGAIGEGRIFRRRGRTASAGPRTAHNRRIHDGKHAKAVREIGGISASDWGCGHPGDVQLRLRAPERHVNRGGIDISPGGRAGFPSLPAPGTRDSGIRQEKGCMFSRSEATKSGWEHCWRPKVWSTGISEIGSEHLGLLRPDLIPLQLCSPRISALPDPRLLLINALPCACACVCDHDYETVTRLDEVNVVRLQSLCIPNALPDFSLELPPPPSWRNRARRAPCRSRPRVPGGDRRPRLGTGNRLVRAGPNAYRHRPAISSDPERSAASMSHSCMS